MMSRSTPWLVAAVCALVGVAVWFSRTHSVNAGPGITAEQLVRNAWVEEAKVPLTGQERIKMRDAHGKPMEVDARVTTSGGGDLHIEYQTGALKGAQVWEDNERTFRYNPKLDRLTVARKRGSAEQQREQREQVLRNYSLTRVGSDIVAGQATAIVELRPHSKTGRVKRIWVDPRTWAILASEDYTESGGKPRVERSSRFTTVRYLGTNELPKPETFRPNDALIRKAQPAVGGSTPVPVAELSEQLGFKLHQPGWLPEGYVFVGAYETPCQCGRKHMAARLEYTDGLNRLSLFECGHQDCKNTENCFAAHGRMAMAVHYESDHVSYLAVGDLPRSELEGVVKSIAP